MRNVTPIAFTALALAGLLASPAEAPAAAPPQTAAASHPVGPTGVVLPATDPMASELRRAIESQQRDYASLLAQLASARSEPDAFAIQAQIQQRQVGLQVDLLRIQAAYARRAGHDRLAWQLDRTIETLITPDAPKPRANDSGKL